MNNLPEPGRILIFIGLMIMVFGFIIHYAGNLFSWFGNLPGDIRITNKNFSFYFPVVSLIIISLIINIFIYILRLFL
ncbi:MAG: DUF2905 domain-containing protein [Halanaerobiaceae bacterium]